jgi:hypothetical protein
MYVGLAVLVVEIRVLEITYCYYIRYTLLYLGECINTRTNTIIYTQLGIDKYAAD